MPKIVFDDTTVRALKFPEKKDEPNEVQYVELIKGASRSLVLYVSHGGSKTWRVQFYVRGKARSRRIGTYPEMSVKQARVAALDFDTGHAVASREAGTFKTVAENWLTDYVDKKRLRTSYEIKRQLTVYLYTVWEKTPIFDIDRLEVNRLLRTIEKRSGASMADYVLATLRSIMTWYAVQDHRFNSPLVRGMQRDTREPKERARSRILDDNEIRAVWKACDELGTYGALVRVLLLTAQRLGVVKSMKWGDLKDGVWTLPELHREKGHIGAVRLPKMALDIIDDQPRIVTNPHVFPAAKGRGPLASFSRGRVDLDALLPKDMPDWVLHDLRRTARSLLSKIGVQRDLAERVLGHTTGGVEAVYDRHSYLEEKSVALDRLAAHIDDILHPTRAKGKVIRMRKR